MVRFLRKGMVVGWNIKKCQDCRVCSLSTLQGFDSSGQRETNPHLRSPLSSTGCKKEKAAEASAFH